METTVNQENEFKALLERSSKVVKDYLKDGDMFTEKNGVMMVGIGRAYVDLDPKGELLQAERYRAFKASLPAHMPNIQELRLYKGLTVSEASKLSGVSVYKIKSWEAKGAAKSPAHEFYRLVNVYEASFDKTDIHRVSKKKQIIEAILSGASTVKPSGRVEIDMDQVIIAMKSEGFDVSELEALCNQDITKRPAVKSVGA